MGHVARMSMEVIVTIVSKLVCFTYLGDANNLLPGGGNSNIFYFHPDPWGFMIQFDDHIFQMGWEKKHHLVLIWG